VAFTFTIPVTHYHYVAFPYSKHQSVTQNLYSSLKLMSQIKGDRGKWYNMPEWDMKWMNFIWKIWREDNTCDMQYEAIIILEWLLQKRGLNWIQVSLSGSSRRGTAVHSKKSFGSTADGGGENISWTAKQSQASYERPHCICALSSFKPGLHQNNIKFSHITENTLHFHYKHYPITSVKGNNACLFWYTQNKYPNHKTECLHVTARDTVNTLLLRVQNLGTKQNKQPQLTCVSFEELVKSWTINLPSTRCVKQNKNTDSTNCTATCLQLHSVSNSAYRPSVWHSQFDCGSHREPNTVNRRPTTPWHSGIQTAIHLQIWIFNGLSSSQISDKNISWNQRTW